MTKVPPDLEDTRCGNARHTDAFEQAAALQERMNEAGLAEVRRAVAPEYHPDFDGKHCIDCGDDIPPKRLEMRRIRCVGCQSRLEVLSGRR
jgi:RNA polymerase-binding transcription factor DksA